MENIFKSVLAGDSEAVATNVKAALERGEKPERIIEEALIKAMDEVGEKMKTGELFVPEVLIAAEAMKEGLLLVKPLLKGESYSIGKVVIGTVAGDLHDIGKNLVAMLLESAGFEVIDLGVDVSVEQFVQAVEEHQPQIVGFSALLTTTMATMREANRAVLEKFDQVKTMVGGGPR